MFHKNQFKAIFMLKWYNWQINNFFIYSVTLGLYHKHDFSFNIVCVCV